MKRLLYLLIVLFCSFVAYAQVPDLSAGSPDAANFRWKRMNQNNKKKADSQKDAKKTPEPKKKEKIEKEKVEKERSDSTVKKPHLPSTVILPAFDGRDNSNFDVLSVVRTSEYTIITGSYVNPHQKGWVNISREAYLRDCETGKVYPIFSADGLPLSPDSILFEARGEKIDFILRFKPIGKTVNKIDLIDDKNSGCGLNVYGIDLTGKKAE